MLLSDFQLFRILGFIFFNVGFITILSKPNKSVELLMQNNVYFVYIDTLHGFY